ncbi:MAG: LytR family transcriptional regulator [Candidatus Saccharibacteria bacterium]|nr:LytR family transcriptional regulator [Candidatus Saccharibacteria bacterium]
MDNFKNHKKRTVGSIDGFVKPKTNGSKSPGDLQSFNTYYQGSKGAAAVDTDSLRISRIDDFKQAEGFSAATQAPIMNPAAENPAEIGEIYASHAASRRERRAQQEAKKNMPKKRRGFMHFRRKQKEPKKPSKRNKLKIGLRVAGVLAAVILLTGGVLALKIYLTTHGILKGGSNGAAALNKNVDPTLLKGEGDGRVNILMLGKGGTGHDGPDLTDTIIIASIDPIAKEVALVSLPRDLWVKTPSGGASKINAIYANAKYAVLNNYTTKQQTDAVKAAAEKAGVKAIESAVTSVLGIPINYYGMVDFQGFAQAINAVHGIDINVKTEVYDTFIQADNNNNPLIAAVGQDHFDGKHALLYAQSRHGSLRGDFDRTERQREVIVALKDKVLSLGTFANPLKVNQLIDAIGDHVSTDFTTNELKRVYDIVKDVPSAKIASIGLADPPNNFVTTDNIDGQSVVIPREGTFVYTAIQSYVRNTLRDSFLKSENANIVILNGTNTPGLATLKSTELKSYGYNVTQVADAPTKAYTKTVLVDMTKGVKKYTKNYLEKRLGVTATTTLPDPSIVPGTADFVIILGSNESGASN